MARPRTLPIGLLVKQSVPTSDRFEHSLILLLSSRGLLRHSSSKLRHLSRVIPVHVKLSIVYDGGKVSSCELLLLLKREICEDEVLQSGALAKHLRLQILFLSTRVAQGRL